MKRLHLIFTLILLNLSVFGQDNLFLIKKGNLWGYIDKSGKEVITPQFKTAGMFSEGLAAVRWKGIYGYIDKSGSFIIKPKFDVALPFQDGQAKVFIDGKPFFIDKTGNITFQHSFKSITSFGNRAIAIATTQTDKYCLINRNGELITDTIFRNINLFIDGVAIVYGFEESSDSAQETQIKTGVIDSTGKWVIQYGRYEYIERFINGYSRALRIRANEENSTAKYDLIDTKGNIKFLFPMEKFFLDYDISGFSDGLAVVTIYPKSEDSTGSIYANHDRRYKGVINTNGVIVFSDTNWKKMTPITFKSAFVQDKKHNWKMINANGKQICDSTFTDILYNTHYNNPFDVFTNGIAWAKLTNGWVKIDTNGKIISQPKVLTHSNNDRLTRVGDIIFIQEDISIEHPHYSYRYGFWNSKTDVDISPTYHEIDMDGFNNDLIHAIKDGSLYCINSNGEVIWQDPEAKSEALSNVDIDFMNRGYFYAYSKPNKKDYGGFGGSNNFPKKITKSHKFRQKALSVVVHPELKDTILGGYHAITVYVANTTGRTINFNAQNSRLYMKVQALSAKGEWRDIEYLPSSWCGNSYHTLALESKSFWIFQSPIYEGAFKTKLRIELTYIDPADKSAENSEKKEITIYSNEYEGSINPGQFWNKTSYQPSGLMDPYYD